MTLNKRYKRSVGSNLSFYISIILLTALVTCMHVAFDSSYGVQQKSFAELLEEAKLEDAEFVTMKQIDDFSDLSEEYNVDVERQDYIDLDLDGSEAEVRLFGDDNEINKIRVQEGKNLSSADDILLSGLFMDRQGIKIGDRIKIEGKEYNVCGKVIRTDYLFCLKNVTDTFSDSDRFGIGVVQKKVFDEYDEKDKATVYAVRYGDDTDVTVFRKKVNEDYGMLSYLSIDNNTRVQSPIDQFNELGFTVNTILPCCMIFMVILISVVLGRKIKNERKMIGVLNALGYKRSELALHYSLFGAIPALVGGVLGTISAYPLLGYLSDVLIEDKMEVFYEVTSIRPMSAVIAIVLPVITYSIAVFITAMINMRGSSIDMIKGLSKNKKKRHGLRKSKMNFKTKYKIRAIFGHFPRTLLVVFGIALGGILVAFTFACVDSIERFVNESVNATGDFEYEYFLKSIETETPSDGSSVTGASFEVKGNADLITMMGVDEDRLLKIEDEDGNTIDLDGKYYISQMSSYAYGLKEGDKITLLNNSNLDEYEIEIAGIFVNGSQSLIVSDRDTVNDLLGLPEGSYNIVMSKEKLDYSDSELLREVSKKSLAESLDKTINQGMHDMLLPISIIAIIISVITTYLMVNILLNESVTVVSMLKVLGYRDGEINSVVTNIYHALLPIGIALGIAAGVWLNKANFDSQAAKYNSFIESYVSVKSIIICVAITLGSYILSMILLGRKVKNVDMAESLKENRE
ncbi:MAG: ABC transporter permease [Clostridia bacterium]|nr:ABC transporter permease [Clostridia bacterium]